MLSIANDYRYIVNLFIYQFFFVCSSRLRVNKNNAVGPYSKKLAGFSPIDAIATP